MKRAVKCGRRTVYRRIRDFQFAQGKFAASSVAKVEFQHCYLTVSQSEKRRKKYGDERPFGILGLYDHLAGMLLENFWID